MAGKERISVSWLKGNTLLASSPRPSPSIISSRAPPGLLSLSLSLRRGRPLFSGSTLSFSASAALVYMYTPACTDSSCITQFAERPPCALCALYTYTYIYYTLHPLRRARARSRQVGVVACPSYTNPFY